MCAFFNSQDEEYRVLAPFFQEGLGWGEKVMHIVDPARIDQHLRQLRAHGIDTEGCQKCGQLEVLGWNDVYLNGGSFDQQRMLGAIDGALQAGKDAGYPRMRIMGNMGWTLEGKPGTDQVLEFEAGVNEVLTHWRQPAVCVYDLSKLSGSMMMDILRSHPLTLVGEIVHENPFYEPATQLLEKFRQQRSGKPMAATTATAANPASA
ncbi:MAG: MEDS domain-containing protein [Burkholderiaceae bacterium]